MELRVEEGRLDSGRRRAGGALLLFPQGATLLTLSLPRERVEAVDRAAFAVVPGGTLYRVAAESPVARLVTIEVSDVEKGAVVREYAPHVERGLLETAVGAPRVLVRPRWLDEVVHRFVFERAVCEKRRTQASRFLEIEIVKEVYFLASEKDEGEVRASTAREGKGLVERVREHLERELFSKLRMKDLARAAGASESTLLRAFRREVGVAPVTYQRDRRLDEARSILRGGSLSIGEVALHVGYTNIPAFTSAFRRRFGAPPSSVAASDRDGAALLPPEGRSARRPRAKAPRTPK